MGGQYPPLDRTQVESILKAIGFHNKSHDGSSHAQWEGYVNGKRRIVTVDHLKNGKKEKYGHRLLKDMIDQSGLSKTEFYRYLK